MSVKQLKAINGLKSSKLKIGQRLTLTGEDRAAQVAAPAQPRQQSSRSGRDVHVVKKGDTLSAIYIIP